MMPPYRIPSFATPAGGVGQIASAAAISPHLLPADRRPSASSRPRIYNGHGSNASRSSALIEVRKRRIVAPELILRSAAVARWSRRSMGSAPKRD